MRKALTINPGEENEYNKILSVARDLGINPPTKIFLMLGRAFVEGTDIKQTLLDFDALASRLNKHFTVLEETRINEERAKEMAELKTSNPELWQQMKALEKESEKLFLENERRRQTYIANELQAAFENGTLRETREKLERMDGEYWKNAVEEPQLEQ